MTMIILAMAMARSLADVSQTQRLGDAELIDSETQRLRNSTQKPSADTNGQTVNSDSKTHRVGDSETHRLRNSVTETFEKSESQRLRLRPRLPRILNC